MNIKSVSGVAYCVSDIDSTVDFYEKLGFREGKKDNRSASVYMNWFWVEFYCEDGGAPAGQNPVGENKASSQEVLLYLSVDDLSETYRALQERGLDPSPEVINKSKGRKETSIQDPNGYRLVFFQKK